VDLVEEGLGPLRMTALSRAGLLHVSLTAGDALVRSQLIDHAADLRREITAAGIDLGSFDVGSFTKHNDGSALSDRHSANSKGTSTVDPAERQPGSKTPTRTDSPASTSRLDLRI
jgi:Flagellar hook-length control protein FliK